MPRSASQKEIKKAYYEVGLVRLMLWQWCGGREGGREGGWVGVPGINIVHSVLH